MKLWKRKEKKRPTIKELVKYLRHDVGYDSAEIRIANDGKSIVIKNVVVISCDNDTDTHDISFASGTIALGACMIVHCLHTRGVHNLVFKENFYVGTDSLQHDTLKTYYGDEADKEWNKDQRMMIEQRMRSKLRQLSEMMTTNLNTTYH